MKKILPRIWEYRTEETVYRITREGEGSRKPWTLFKVPVALLVGNKGPWKLVPGEFKTKNSAAEYLEEIMDETLSKRKDE
jgi:hypothetical protein